MTAPSSLPNASSQASDSQPRARSSTPGSADQLGNRQLACGHAAGTWLEVLRFKKEFGDSSELESTLRARVEPFKELQHTSLSTVRSVERVDAHLILVSKHVTGRRVS